MSDRNTGLFVAGHLAPEEVAEVFAKAPQSSELVGEEGPRVGHGDRDGHLFTHVGLRLFEAGGLLLMDKVEVPDPQELEMHLGATLSRMATHAVYLFCDEERGAGGHARFQDGRLVSRVVFDGREFTPVLRDLDGERPIEELDPSDWIWPLIAEALETGAQPVFGSGVRTDDDLEALIRMAGGEPVTPEADPVLQPQSAPQMRPQDPTLRRVLRGFAKKLRGN